ncbi:AIM24 family protein [Ornithinicoccus halotolerans]|uniref:AIM24 family protein n=1 Tax=Ornithinicoccus halotolerans TaxID=1748220 RepID=UPI001297B665|nr:AIM24 family protein [Ornithinicoccus halotolerans]
MTIHGQLFERFQEDQSQDPFVTQNSKMLKVQMGYGPVWARAGSMVAYQGDVKFANKGSGGLDRFLKSKLTGEGVPMMQCSGQGEMFLADGAADVQVLYLEDDMVSVNGKNVLAFSHSIDWDIHRVQARGGMMAGGLYNVSLRGTGYVAVTTEGPPVALDVSGAQTFADAQAVVMWTAGVHMDVRVDTGGLASLVRGGTGEMVQMGFSGQGHVLVQPSEGKPTPTGDGGGNRSRGGGLADVLRG